MTAKLISSIIKYAPKQRQHRLANLENITDGDRFQNKRFLPKEQNKHYTLILAHFWHRYIGQLDGDTFEPNRIHRCQRGISTIRDIR